MPQGRGDDVVQPLHRAPTTPGRRTDLRPLTAEQAATVLVDEFARTGCSEALVADPRAVRQLVRRDCRRRRLRVSTRLVGVTVVVVDDARHDRWLRTEEGREYARQRDDAMIAALEAAMPKTPRPNPLRPVE